MDTKEFKGVIEDIVDARISKKGITKFVSAVVKTVNSNGSVDVYLPPDTEKIVSGVLNKTGEKLSVGDSVELCAKNGKTSNAWVSVKHGTNFSVGNISSANCTVSSGVTIISQPIAKKNNLTNTVQLSGLMSRNLTLGTWNDLCTIPSGYRPTIQWDFGGINNQCNTAMHIRIYPGGKVQVFPTTYTAPSGTSAIPVYINTMYML